MDREKIESTRLKQEMAGSFRIAMAMTLAERQQIAGLPGEAGDVTLTGIAIYEAIMEQFGFNELTVSTRGLRYWALLRPR